MAFYTQCCRTDAEAGDRYCRGCGAALTPAVPDRGTAAYERFGREVSLQLIREGQFGPQATAVLARLERR